MDTRLETGFHVNHSADDDLLVEHREDVEPTLDYCRKMRGTPQRRTRSGMRKVASIPNVVYYDWMRKGILKDQIKFRRALEEYKKLKCVEDRLWIPASAQKRIYKDSGIIR